MNIYKVTKKKPKDAGTWFDELVLLIEASSFANAEDKANNFEIDYKISQIQRIGDTTQKQDVYKLNDRL